MFYKITNKDCKVYQKLYEQRKKEIQAEKDNKKLLEELIDFKWTKYYGHTGQQTFYRVTEYLGFIPLNEDEVDKKKWRKDKNMKGAYVPNLRSKSGKMVHERFRNDFKKFRFYDVWDILGIDIREKFVFPYVEIVGDVIVIYLDEKQEPKDPNVIEITKTEFENILKELEKNEHR